MKQKSKSALALGFLAAMTDAQWQARWERQHRDREKRRAAALEAQRAAIRTGHNDLLRAGYAPGFEDHAIATHDIRINSYNNLGDGCHWRQPRWSTRN